LSILVDAVHQLGIHRAYAIPAGVKDLLQDYQTALLSSVFDDDFLERVNAVGKARRVIYVQQLQSNIALLKQVLMAVLGKLQDDQYAKKWTSLDKRVGEVCDNRMMHQCNGLSFLIRQLAEHATFDDQKSRDTFLRTQNLLAPLLSSSRPSFHQKSSELSSMLLPFGVPPTANASEAMLDLARPGPRLALLPVNATAA
jgi:hypothetical protein